MSREIKFSFVYGIDGQPETYFCKTFTLAEIEAQFHVDIFRDANAQDDGLSILASRQYTGLKDKNGVEVYEGDVLEFEWKIQKGASNGIFRAEVKFRNGAFFFEWGVFKTLIHDIRPIDSSVMWKEEYNAAPDAYYELINIRSIGNIHQNPELMGSK